jgi:hypothetical protein
MFQCGPALSLDSGGRSRQWHNFVWSGPEDVNDCQRDYASAQLGWRTGVHKAPPIKSTVRTQAETAHFEIAPEPQNPYNGRLSVDPFGW